MRLRYMPVDKLIKKTGSSEENGLKTQDVNKNRCVYGANVITKAKGKTFIKRLIEALFDPMLIILEFAWVVTFGVNVGKALKTGNGNFYECFGILIAILISVVLTLYMEGKSQKAFDVLNSVYDKTTVKVIRNGKIDVIEKSDLVVGDVMLLSSGEKVCADARIITSENLSVDESMLTGESLPVKKDAYFEINEKTPLAECKSMIFGGTLIVGGSCKAVVTEVGDNAEMGLIAGELQAENAVSAPLKEKLSRLGKLITVLGVISSLVVLIMSVTRLIITKNVSFQTVEEAVIQAIVLIVASVPEGLPTTVAISLSLNVVKLAKSNALIKKLVATETVGCVSVICSDKTGTLTENEMSVEEIYSFDEKKVIENVCVNTTAEVIKENKTYKKTGNITECALLKYVLEKGIDYGKKRKEIKIVDRKPFDSSIKYMTTTVETKGGRITYIKGAYEAISTMCSMTENERKRTKNGIEAEQSTGKRVICFAHAKNGEKTVFDGYAVIEDGIRKDVLSAVKECLSSGIDVKILTGDNISTARYVAEKLGLLTGDKVVLTADTVDVMSDENLKNNLDKIAVIARSTPSTKLRIVRLLKSKGEVVAVTGDGINDAPAIKHADIGIAMGDGSEIAKEASDIVLLDNSFSTIVKAISFGRNIYKNFQSFIMFQLTVNATAVIVIIATLILGLKPPFTTLQLLWINIIMDGPPALSLGLKVSEKSYLREKPVKRSDNIVTGKILCRIILHAVYVASVIMLQTKYNFLGFEQSKTRTCVFTLFTFFQLANALNCAETGKRSIFCSIKDCKLILAVIGFTVILQILLTEFLGKFLSVVPLSLTEWIKLTLIPITVIVLSEGYKFIYRKITERQNSQYKNLKSVNEKGSICIE